MHQIELFDTKPLQERQHIVNVATVPQRSPFRYPGGKTWLIPRIRQWLLKQGGLNKELIEPFTGGGIVSLTAVFEDLVGQVTMVEKDEGVAAVWQTILEDDAEWLADAIRNFHLTPENARRAIETSDQSLRSLAFATIVKNRVNRGGILADAASFIRQGENGKGITSRWYPETLQKRILAIAKMRHKIKFIKGDGFEICEQNAHRKDAIYFIDPPYINAGRRLYRYSIINHKGLFELANKLEGDFLMSYDNNQESQALAAHQGFTIKSISMKNTHHAEKKELLIGRDLSWLLQ
ncbi:DNA adenine methylase [Trichothermofontia sichuanensis B231]|uniref:DNA adenine methylase n=1 Tax=Trichothermofontia sichuanensis TaxID=3045816 RepID=UPI0022477727|nr:DNA adenine methylase [Trichothermofontia sichuanensis]UZQ53534.1 DNA adenine methylase [Trichothermofontia sichuanensis B231]